MAIMTLDRGGGLLSVQISVGPVQKTFWSVSKRSLKTGGGFSEWERLATFDDRSGGAVNQTIEIADCASLIGSQISIVFFVMRVNFNQADPYRVKAQFSCANGSAITGGDQADSGNLDHPHVIEQFDFVVEAA